MLVTNREMRKNAYLCIIVHNKKRNIEIMDKNTLTGFLLIALVVIGFSYFGQPSQEEIIEQHRQDSIQKVQTKQAEKERITKENQERLKEYAALQDTTTLFGSAKKGNEQLVALQNSQIKLTLSNKGGNIISAELYGYKNQKKDNVILFDRNTASLNYTLPLKEENVNTKDYYFDIEDATDSTVTMALHSSKASMKLVYKLLPGTCMVNCSIQSQGIDPYLLPNQQYMLIDWQDTVMQQEKGFDFESRYSTLTYKLASESSTDYLSETESDRESIQEPVQWIAFKNQFFSSVMIGSTPFTQVQLSSDPMEKHTGRLKHYHANMQTEIPTPNRPVVFQFYFGPNQYQLLQGMDQYSVNGKELELENLVYLGWPLFRYINRYFTIYLFSWLTQWGLNMGVVLLILTLILKVLVYPTTRKSYLSSAKMRVLKPKLDEVQKKYPNKEDSMLMQQEIMATYSKYGVSPMSGCLPILLQTPIWIAMFNFVPNAIELRGQQFLWSDDLSTYDSIIEFNTQLPLIGDHISLFCLLFCGTNLLYSWMNMKLQKDSMASTQAAQQMKMMQWMMMLMPIFFFFVFNSYSAGLNYYYWISLLFSAITMWYLKWRTDDAKLLEQLEKNYEKNMKNPQKLSGMQARLQALQQEAIKQRMNQKKH